MGVCRLSFAAAETEGGAGGEKTIREIPHRGLLHCPGGIIRITNCVLCIAGFSSVHVPALLSYRQLSQYACHGKLCSESTF